MACNRESSADGTSPVPPPPAPSTPSSCPNPDVLVPCCNNCHISGCSASMNLCPKCSSERLRKEEATFNPSKQKVDLATETTAGVAVGICDVTPMTCPPAEEADKKDMVGMAQARISEDIAHLHIVMKSTSSSARCKVLVSAPPQPSGSCTVQEQRIPSPLSLPPPQQGKADPSVTALPRDRAVNRCAACQKRMGLLGFKCRCGDLFCASHRYSDKHECPYDYKAAGRLAIAKENPVVIASKISKI